MTELEWYEHLGQWSSVWAGGISIGLSFKMLLWILFWNGRAVTEFLRSR